MIESKILQCASEKCQLEALVIAKGALIIFSPRTITPTHDPHPGKLKAPIGSNAKAETRQTIAEMAAQLLDLEGEHIEVVPSTAAGTRSVISDAELDMMPLGSCKEVFEGRGVGWKSGAEATKEELTWVPMVARTRLGAFVRMRTAACSRCMREMTRLRICSLRMFLLYCEPVRVRL